MKLTSLGIAESSSSELRDHSSFSDKQRGHRRERGKRRKTFAIRRSLTRRANLAVRTVHDVPPQVLSRKGHAHAVSTRKPQKLSAAHHPHWAASPLLFPRARATKLLLIIARTIQIGFHYILLLLLFYYYLSAWYGSSLNVAVISGRPDTRGRDRRRGELLSDRDASPTVLLFWLSRRSYSNVHTRSVDGEIVQYCKELKT